MRAISVSALGGKVGPRATLALAEHVDRTPSRALSSAPWDCPRCKTELKPAKLSEAAITYSAKSCPACKGFWVSDEQLTWIEMDQSPHEFRNIPDTEAQQRPLQCPECKRTMDKVRSDRDANVVMDVCQPLRQGVARRGRDRRDPDRQPGGFRRQPLPVGESVKSKSSPSLTGPAGRHQRVGFVVLFEGHLAGSSLGAQAHELWSRRELPGQRVCRVVARSAPPRQSSVRPRRPRASPKEEREGRSPQRHRRRRRLVIGGARSDEAPSGQRCDEEEPEVAERDEDGDDLPRELALVGAR